ncbi:hypothetical protein CC78DRAFT_472953 [Lojkania enalia]|uniref:BTB domain-containing protein n=1 Tax=Lojkania enalia TaxID=147567 RepID=A0A9P4K1F0_9PLEO|nr:hypothetical protein CC78DRAFT_472953 [Didymosphaeria enalia]
MNVTSSTNDASDTPPSTITLDVGGQKFKTLLSTLTSESGYFHSLFSGRWAGTPTEGESYFIDADPDTFKHLLRYMRRPGVFPLFWSKSSGFDYSMYKRLEHEASFFQIDELSAWIKRQGYLDEIQLQIGMPLEQSINLIAPKTIKGNEEIDHHFFLESRNVYLCPRRIHIHRGHPEKCGAACRKVQGDAAVEYEEEQSVRVVVTSKTFQFNN